MGKYVINDVSIIFSLKVDSIDRINNLRCLLNYFNSQFNGLEIIIVEQGKASKPSLGLDNIETANKIIYEYIKDSGPHYKTRNLNFATCIATRPIVMMCDCDVVLPPQSLLKAVKRMRTYNRSILSPHNGVMVEIPKEYFSANSNEIPIDSLVFFPRSFDRNIESYDCSKMHPIYGGTQYFSTGGCILYNKRDFFKVGGWNTNIISYGYEDMEFIYRAKKLGLKHLTFRNNNIYHLQHYRGKDSLYNNFYRSNELEWKLVTSMDSDELQVYCLNGFRRLVLAPNFEYSIINTKQEYSITRVSKLKVDLSEASIIVIVESIPKDKAWLVSTFVGYLERYFVNYEIDLIELRSRNCLNLSNKRSVKYNWCMESDDKELERFMEKIVNSVSGTSIWLWDFKSYIDPEEVRKSVNTFDKNSLASIFVKDKLWVPEGVFRTKKKGRGLVIAKKGEQNEISNLIKNFVLKNN